MVQIWTSARRRAHHSAWPFIHSGYKVEQKQIMSEINPFVHPVSVLPKEMLRKSRGVWDGLTAQEAQERYPDEWERFLDDPYAHRAPRAESYHDLSVRIEPIIFELERVRDDLLIIGHASVIRCLLAYLVGLPPNEVPAVEIARGDLVEVTPASYGVMTRAFHFWSGEGRGDAEGQNLYENFAEGTSGKGSTLPPDSGVMFARETQNMEDEAAEEEAKDKEIQAGFVKDTLRKRMNSIGGDGARSAPTLAGVMEEVMSDEAGVDDLMGDTIGGILKGETEEAKRGRASTFLFIWAWGDADV